MSGNDGTTGTTGSAARMSEPDGRAPAFAAARWADQPDDVLVGQGRASAATGQAIATRLVPELADLERRLGVPGAEVLDVGTGIGALALALARALPAVRVTGIDVLPRALELARAEAAGAGPEAGRVQLRELDVVDLQERDRYELAWLPAPFLSAEAVRGGLAPVVRALVPGGWLVVGTAAPGREVLAADVALSADAEHRHGRADGDALDAGAIRAMLRAHGLDGLGEWPTFPGGPVLVAGRRPAGSPSAGACGD